MSKEVTRYDLRVTDDGAGLYATDEPNTRGMQYVSALDYEALLAERDAALKALTKLAEVSRGCERLASDYSGCIDGVDEHGGDDHEDPICAVFHRLYYAMFDADAAISALQGEQP